MKIAVVGAGYFSQFHLEGWRDMPLLPPSPQVQLVSLCDLDLAKASRLAAQFGLTQVFDDVAQMLDATQPDLVDVAVPPAAQAEVLKEVISRRIPVVCQKPFGVDYAQAVALTEQAEAANVSLIVHENFRFMPWYREAKRLVDLGQLGTLYNVSFRLRTGDGQGPDAYLDRQPYFQTMPRLLVLETAIHYIDTFRFLVGEVDAVYAKLRRLNPVIAGEDAALITFEFANGAAGLFDGNRLVDHVAANPRRTLGEMWLEGSAGVLRLDGDARLWWKPRHDDEVLHVYDSGGTQSFGGGACGRLQAHVVNALATSSPIENTARNYLHNLRVQEAIYASHHSGRRIALAGFEPVAA
jgi:D-apiose dehydrogenase